MTATSQVSYAAFTESPEEWNQAQSQNCDGVYRMGSPEGTRALGALIQRASEQGSGQQIVAVLVDELASLVAIDEARPLLRWLFLSGPAHGIWPFVTLDPERMQGLSSWLAEFHTRLFGSMENPHTAANLAGDGPSHLIPQLVPGSQFAMRDGSAWLPFWIPRLD